VARALLRRVVLREEEEDVFLIFYTNSKWVGLGWLCWASVGLLLGCCGAWLLGCILGCGAGLPDQVKSFSSIPFLFFFSVLCFLFKFIFEFSTVCNNSIMLIQSRFGLLTIVLLFYLNSYFILNYLYICELYSK
jgi:hypothetical protein